MRQRSGTEALARVREMRRNLTPEEKLLWKALRSRRLNGHKFRRQAWVITAIADFLCFEARLIIELDGGQHAINAEEDAQRTAMLEREGYRVLRFWNNQVRENIEGVMQTIAAALDERVPSLSHAATPRGALPLPEGERDI